MLGSDLKVWKKRSNGLNLQKFSWNFLKHVHHKFHIPIKTQKALKNQIFPFSAHPFSLSQNLLTFKQNLWFDPNAKWWVYFEIFHPKLSKIFSSVTNILIFCAKIFCCDINVRICEMCFILCRHGMSKYA